MNTIDKLHNDCQDFYTIDKLQLMICVTLKIITIKVEIFLII